jgi:hypothetical protein
MLASAPHEDFHPLVASLFTDEDLDDEGLDGAQARLRERVDAEGARDAVLTAVRAVYLAAAGRDEPRMDQLDSAEPAVNRRWNGAPTRPR